MLIKKVIPFETISKEAIIISAETCPLPLTLLQVPQIGVVQCYLGLEVMNQPICLMHSRFT